MKSTSSPAVNMDQDVVMRTVDLFDKSMDLSAGSTSYCQEVNYLDLASRDLPHGPNLGGHQGNVASAKIQPIRVM